MADSKREKMKEVLEKLYIRKILEAEVDKKIFTRQMIAGISNKELDTYGKAVKNCEIVIKLLKERIEVLKNL